VHIELGAAEKPAKRPLRRNWCNCIGLPSPRS